MFNRNNLIIIGIVVVVLILLIFIPKKTPNETGVGEVNTSQESTGAVDLYKKAKALEKDRNLLDAKKMYQKIITDYPDFEFIEDIQKSMEKISMEVIFSNTVTPQTVMHEVVSGDTLGVLAKRYGTTIELIKISNHLKSDVIRIGQKLRIWTGTFSILVDKSQNILILKADGEVVKVYDVSTGQGNSTPVGEFKVTVKLEDPVWFNRGVVVPPESPHNVLGSRWLGFDIPGYGIHGTVEPETIGTQVTAGCVRMRNEDVEELYNIIPNGTKVVIVD